MPSPWELLCKAKQDTNWFSAKADIGPGIFAAIFGAGAGYLGSHNDKSFQVSDVVFPAIVAVLAIVAYWLIANSLEFIWNLTQAGNRLEIDRLKAFPGGKDNPIEPKAQVFIEPFSPDGAPSGAGWVGHGELPKQSGRVLPLRLFLSATAAVLLEQVELEIAGRRLLSGWESDWLGVGITTDATVEFALTDHISKGSHDARVLGYAEGQWFASKPFNVEVP